MSDAHPTARFYALIPCAGSGSRAGTASPKQYQPVAGRPMVSHTLAAFAAVPAIGQCLVVVAPGDDVLPRRTDLPEKVSIGACGGATRAASVLAGLEQLVAAGARADDWVLVHDAARCLITPAQIETLIRACQADPVGGLLAHRVADTLKQEAAGRVVRTVDRSDKWLAQTPQMFRIGLLRQALSQAGTAVTDEASAIEALGMAPLLVPADALNFKVTYPEDFALAEAVLRSRA